MERLCIRSISCFLILGLLSISNLGCGGSPYTLVPVSGNVTDSAGNPVSDVAIVFHPIYTGENSNYGPTSSAYTDSQGHYVLRDQVKLRKGAIAGKYIVRVWPRVEQDSENDEVMEESRAIPAEYNDESSLTFTVPESGTDAANFSLDL